MRVTDTAIYGRIGHHVGQARQRLDAATRSLMSGVKHDQPSANPAYTARLTRLDRDLARTDRWTQSIDRTRTVYQTAEATIASSSELVSELQAMAVQMANGSVSAADRKSSASVVLERLADLQGQAKTTIAGRFLFSGRREGVAPFDAAGNYVGDTVGRTLPIADGRSVAGDVIGSEVFGSGATSAFAVLADFAKALETNDVAGIQTAIASLTQTHDQMVSARTRVGVVLQSLESTSALHADHRVALEIRRAELADPDIAAQSSELSFSENVLQSVVETSKRLMSSLRSATLE